MWAEPTGTLLTILTICGISKCGAPEIPGYISIVRISPVIPVSLQERTWKEKSLAI
jgi:hypothetical protein